MKMISMLAISAFLALYFSKSYSVDATRDNDSQMEAEKLLRQAEELGHPVIWESRFSLGDSREAV